MKKNIYRLVSTDDSRPSLMGVFHDGENKVAVAANYRLMLVSKPDYNEQLVNAERHSYDKDGREIKTQNYPHYTGVFSEGRRLNANRKEAVVGNLNAKAVEAALNAAKELGQRAKDLSGDKKHAITKGAYVRVGDDWFDAELLSQLLPYFGDGAEVIMPEGATWRGAYLKNNDYEAIVMPCQHREVEEGIVAHAYAISEGSGVDIDQYIPESAL